MPTDTLQLATSGAGTDASPLIITGRVTMDMVDLEDVRDSPPPTEGQVPVWTTDHWEFKIPASAPPGSVNRGAGLIGDGSAANPLLAAISGTWGSGSMAGFPVDTTLGNPIYTDSLGQLRGRPTPSVRHAEHPIGTFEAGWGPAVAGSTPGPTWVQFGNLIAVQFGVLRTGATIPAAPYGDLPNSVIGTLRNTMPLPLIYGPLTSGLVGHILGTGISPTGAVLLGATVPTAPIPSGGIFFLTGIYLANSGVVL